MNCDLKEISKDIRCNILYAVSHVGVGHLGGSLSIADLLALNEGVLADVYPVDVPAEKISRQRRGGNDDEEAL